jgi:hypothetical protein
MVLEECVAPKRQGFAVRKQPPAPGSTEDGPSAWIIAIIGVRSLGMLVIDVEALTNAST